MVLGSPQINGTSANRNGMRATGVMVPNSTPVSLIPVRKAPGVPKYPIDHVIDHAELQPVGRGRSSVVKVFSFRDS